MQDAVPNARPNWLVWAICAGLAVAFPFLGTPVYVLHVAILFLVWSVVTQAWNLIIGVAGIYSLAQLAFFAVGGYTSALLVTRAGWSPWAGLPAGALAAVAASLVIGLPVLRLTGVYVVLLTLAFHEILRQLILTDDTGLTGTYRGLQNLPTFGIEAFGTRAVQLNYLMALVLFGLVTLLCHRVIHSPLGLAFKALRDSEGYAVSRGISPYRVKLTVFALSAFLTGIMGVFYAHYVRTISPSVLDFGLMMNLMAMMVIGGWGTFAGPVVGTAAMVFFMEVLREAEQWRLVALGAVLVLMVILMPRGIVPTVAGLVSWFRDLLQADSEGSAASD